MHGNSITPEFQISGHGPRSLNVFLFFLFFYTARLVCESALLEPRDIEAPQLIDTLM